MLNRNIVSVALASIILGFAGSLFWTVFNLFLWDLNYTLLAISILNIIPTIISVVFSRFFGRWADIVSRKRFIVIGIGISSLGYLLLYILIVSSKLHYMYLILIFALFGLGGSINSGAFTAVSTTMFKREKTGTSFGAYLSMNAIGWTIGSFLSGYIADNYGMAMVTLITATMSLLAASILAIIYVEPRRKREKRVTRIFRESLALRVEGNVRALTYIYAITAIFTLGSSIYNLAFSIKIYLLFESKTVFGFIMGLAGITNTFSPLLAGRLADKTSKEKLLLGGLITRDLYMAYLAIAWDKLATILFMILPFWVFIHVPIVSATTDYSYEGHESEIQGIRGIVASISNAIGTLMSGIIARIFDVRHNIPAINIVLIIGTIVYFLTILPAVKLYKSKSQ